MTEEERKLLLIDLCARLPYEVKVLDDMGRVYELQIGNAYLIDLYYENGERVEPPIKPYLRPMSSMTEEEEEEYDFISADSGWGLTYGLINECFDWLNAHHFDYRNLIKRGLAVKAPEYMYNIK